MQIPNFIFFLLLLISFCSGPSNCFNSTAAKADVGVILDLNTTLGKIFKTCISMSIEDFYYKHQNYTTLIVPHFRDSKSDVVVATSSAIDLLKNTQVMAIFGPQRSTQADFVIDIGNKIHVPIISPATSPAISPADSPYFIRSAWSSSSQAKAIAATVEAFGWRKVTFIRQKSKFGSGLLKFLFEGLIEVSQEAVLCTCPGDDEILKELYNLKTMQSRVFVVDMEPKLASRFFRRAKEAGMMGNGYAWIIVDPLTSLLFSSMDDSEAIEAMQGVIGLKAYVPRSNQLKNFDKRWSKRFLKDNPEMGVTGLNVYGLWAYDSMMALAEAVERVGVTSKNPIVDGRSLMDLDAIGTSNIGPSLAPLIRNYTSRGLSGNFNMSNGELQASAFEIVNVIGSGVNRVGFWTEKYGLSKKLKLGDDNGGAYSTKKENLGAIIWPGSTNDVPKGWEIPTSGKKLRVGVPMRGGFEEIINVDKDPETGDDVFTGFSVDVFEEVMRLMPYAVPFEFIPYKKNQEYLYDDLVRQIYLGEFDAVVGDVTVTANRSEFADFTIPYTESGVVAIVPVRDSDRNNTWIFMKPLTTGLWLTILTFFVLIGVVIWILEHRVNKKFRGPPLHQVGTTFYFSFSMLVFAHRERVMSNLTRIVVIIWLFVVLVLTQSYTASLTSMLTVQQLQPTITEISDLIKSGEYIGYQRGSFVSGFLDNMDFDRSKFRSFTTAHFDEALSNGSLGGGVAAIIDEVPYIKLFLSKYCHKYTMIGPTYKTSGFGFAFPKGSPLVPDVSRAILKLKEKKKMVEISEKWFLDEEEEGRCQGDGSGVSSERLSVDSFKGLFVIAGITSSLALAIFFSTFLYHNRRVLTSNASIKQKIYELAMVFRREKDDESSSGGEKDAQGSPAAITILCDNHSGLPTIELATPPPTHHVTQP